MCYLLSSAGAPELVASHQASARAIGSSLSELLLNNPTAASPRLDRHVTEITLALIVLFDTGHEKQANAWLAELARRLDFCFARKYQFPIGTDSLDDLVEIECDPDSDRAAELMKMSWMLETIASWCAIRGLDDSYRLLALGHNKTYAIVTAQLWHPTAEWPTCWHFDNPVHSLDDSEAPFELPAEPDALRVRIRRFLEIDRYVWPGPSLSRELGFVAIDFIACRHHRTPIPASFWFRGFDPTNHGA